MSETQDVDKTKAANQSTEKVFTIIELLAQHREPMRLLDISKALGFNASTVLRFLSTLMECGYVDQDKDTLRYYMTFKICNIANKVSTNSSVREIAHPHLKQLSKAFGESVCLAIEQDRMVVYIDVVEGPDQMLRTMQRIGNIAPLHCTGNGKLFLLGFSQEKLEEFIRVKGLQRYTQNTLTSKMQLVSELEKVRLHGYAYDNEECELGARCIAFPIRDYTGKIVAGISVTGPTSRMTDKFIQDRKEYIENVADEISKKLGFAQ